MPTSTISNIVKDQSGNAVAGIPVVIDLVPGPAFRINDGSEIYPVVETKSDVTGAWAVPLEQSSNIDPSSAYYRVREMLPKVKGGQKTWFFIVPSTSPTKLHDCLTVPTVANSLIRPVVVTSSTRPVAPYIGQQIFESDTGRVLYYYGSTVGWQPDWTQAWGEIASISGTAGDFNTSATAYAAIAAMITGNFNTIAGRQYVSIFSAWMECNTAIASVFVAIYDATGLAVLSERVFTLAAQPVQIPMEIYYRELALSGSVNRSVRMYVSSASASGKLAMSSLHPAVLSIRDVGPRAAPVITP